MENYNPENNKFKTSIREVNNYGENYGEIYRFSCTENLESNGRNFILHFIVAQISKKENVPDLAHSLTVYIFNFTDSSHYDIRLSRDHG